MAFTDTNTCEGTSGTAVTNANSAGPTQFSSTGLSGAGNTLTYDNAQVLRGSTSVKCLVGGTAGASYVVWTFTAEATIYSRKYTYFSSLPSSNTRLAAYIDGSGSLLRGGIYINTSGKILTVNSASSTIHTSTTTIPTGQWVRLEFDCTGDPSAGVLTCRIYTTPDSVTPTETLNDTSQNTGGTIGQIWIGSSDSSTTSSTHWQDDIGVTDVEPMGPSFTQTVVTPVPRISVMRTEVVSRVTGRLVNM